MSSKEACCSRRYLPLFRHHRECTTTTCRSQITMSSDECTYNVHTCTCIRTVQVYICTCTMQVKQYTSCTCTMRSTSHPYTADCALRVVGHMQALHGTTCTYIIHSCMYMYIHVRTIDSWSIEYRSRVYWYSLTLPSETLCGDTRPNWMSCESTVT